MSVQAIRLSGIVGTVTSQEFIDINLVSNSVGAFVELNQGERVFAGVTTQSSLADSDVFTFGLSGNNPILLSKPAIIVTDASQSGASVALNPLTINFQIPVGQPFSFGLGDHANTHGGETGDATSTGVIPPIQFVLPANVAIEPCTGCPGS